MVAERMSLGHWLVQDASHKPILTTRAMRHQRSGEMYVCWGIKPGCALGTSHLFSVDYHEAEGSWQVQAHGGGMLAWGGRYYWVGEGVKPGCTPGDFGDGCWPRTAEMSQDINLYSSSDLASWTFESALLNQARPARADAP